MHSLLLYVISFVIVFVLLQERVQSENTDLTYILFVLELTRDFISDL